MRRAFGFVLAACGALVACSSNSTPAPAGQPEGTASAPVTGVSPERRVSVAARVDEDQRPSPLRYHSRPPSARLGGVPRSEARIDAPPTPAPEPLLTYRSGPLLQTVDIHAVYWGSNVTPPTGADLPTYFTKIASPAPFFQMLAEYNVDAGASQLPYTIGSGTFAGTYVDVDAPLPSSKTITDEMVQAEVTRLIDQGKVTNTANSLYFFFFPPGYAIDQGGGTLSCQVFCGYHMSFSRNAANVYYAIIPDFSTDCAQGCGATALDGLYLTVSHELVEAVTDSNVGGPDPSDLAWYDDANGEIGDICGGYAGTASGETVQLMWSNEAHGCRDHKGGGLDTIKVTPAEQTVAAGASTTFSLALSGDAGAAALDLSGLPTNFTDLTDGGAPGFFPTPLNPGASATASLAVAATSRSADYSFVAQATDSDGVVHYAQPTVHVVGAAPTIASFTPATGPTSGGTAVTVTGTNFGVGSTATVGGIPAQGGYVGGTGGTSFTLTTPSHAAGSAPIVITNLNDAAHPATSPTPFVYTAGAAPTVTSVAPNAGPTTGGQVVTIIGTNFGSNATVKFGGTLITAANQLNQDAQTILINTPSHASGSVDVVVTNADGQVGTLGAGYKYGANPSPGIDSLSVNQGPTAGGTYVTIYGNIFGSPSTVKFGGTAGTVMSVNGAFVGVVTPAHAAGAVAVELTNPDNQVTTATTQFTFVDSAADGGADSGGPDDAGPIPGTDAGPTPGNDAGPTPTVDSGVPSPADAAADASGGGGGGGGGCGCAVPGEARGSTTPVSLLAFGALVVAAKRRRARVRS